MAFGNILNDVKGVLATVNSLFGGSSSPYPDQINGVGIDQISNQPAYNDKNWKASRGYAFSVVEVDPKSNAIIGINDGNTDALNWDEFRLQINPQELSQDEVFAIEVTPTLRGVLVEHQGVLIKDISISGTTGVSPMRRDGGAFSDTGNPIFQVGHSGYKEFHELRTYFRAYAEAKRTEDRSESELRMVFKNFKDNEYLFVEPQKFTMKRSADKPFHYDYSISLKGIGVASGIKPPQLDFFEKINAVLEDIQDYLDAAVKIIRASSGILLRFQRDINSTLLGPLLALRQAIAAIKGGRALYLTQLGITRKIIDDLLSKTNDIRNNFSDGIGRSMSLYNEYSGRTPTIVGSPGRISTYQEIQIINALNKVEKALLLTASQQSKLFEQSIFDRNRTVVDQFNGKFALKNPSSVRQVTIKGSDDIHTIASRELRNPDRFRDLVILNNLKPPYISTTPGEGVLSPGDPILIPQNTPSQGSTGTQKNKQYNITTGMTEAQKNLGVDLRLNEDGDLVISNTKDLDLVAGMDNMSQTLSLRLSLEKGSLKRHTFVGTSLVTGRKVSAQGLSDLRQQIVTSLTTDSRVLSIPFIELIQDGGTTKINMVIALRNVEQPVPLSLAIG